MDSKDFLQKAWIWEGMALLAFSAVACAWMPVERLDIFVRIIPFLAGSIGLQGGAAAIGPEVARRTELKKLEIEKEPAPVAEVAATAPVAEVAEVAEVADVAKVAKVAKTAKVAKKGA
jgi:hypothetical protein